MAHFILFELFGLGFQGLLGSYQFSWMFSIYLRSATIHHKVRHVFKSNGPLDKHKKSIKKAPWN